jgi:MFS family permease
MLNRDFILLWQGQFVSLIGSQAFIVAMMYWTMEATGSASLMGGLMMLSMLPGVVLGPLGGTVADRYSRKLIIICADLISGMGVLAVALFFFLLRDSTSTLLLSLFVFAILNGIVQAFFRPAILAAVPDLVPSDRVTSANSMNQFSYQFSQIIGQGGGGVLYALLGAPIMFLVDGLTFLFSALSESFIHIPQKRDKEASTPGETIARFRSALLDGLRYVWQWKGMRNFLMMVGVVHFFAMPFMVLMPFYVELNLGGGAEWYGFLMAGFSAGSVLGYGVAGAITITPRARSRLLVVCLSVAGVIFGMLGILSVPLMALFAIGAAGTTLGMFNVHVMTIFQTTSSSDLRGRVMGLVMTIANAASPLGMVVGGIAGDLTNKNIPLIYGVCGAAIVVSVLLLGTRRSVQDYLATKPVQERDSGAWESEQ